MLQLNPAMKGEISKSAFYPNRKKCAFTYFTFLSANNSAILS